MDGELTFRDGYEDAAKYAEVKRQIREICLQQGGRWVDGRFYPGFGCGEEKVTPEMIRHARKPRSSAYLQGAYYFEVRNVR